MTTVNPHMTGSSSKSAKDNQQAAQSADNSPAKLCYVDDSRTSAYVVKRLLRPYGYAVDHYDSAEPALIALVKENYDLLLTDLKVSPTGMDGDDLVRALRNSGHEKISSLPVIVITGSTDETVLKEVYEAGANQILSKPVNGDELDNYIRALVNTGKQDDKDESKELNAEEKSEAKTIEPVTAKATVVPFDSEAKSSSKAQSSGESDNIPVLNAQSKEDAEAKRKPSEPSISAKRRILKSSPAINFKDDAIDESSEQKITPKPIISVKPASRVKPSVKLSTPSKSAESSPQKLSPEQITAQQKLQKAKELAKRRKMLAAAATKKRAEAADQRRQESNIGATGGTVKATTKPKFDINKIPTDHLSLEPLDDGSFAAFNDSPKVEAKATKESVTQAEQTKQVPPVGVQTIHSDLNADAISESVQDYVTEVAEAVGLEEPASGETEKSKDKNENFQAQFQAEVEAATNILQEMERYPLVESDLSSSYTPSRVMSAVGSVLELYGPKKIITTILLLAVGFFAYNTWKEYFDDGTAVEVTTVEQGEIFQAITVPGKVVSKLRVNLTPSIAGRLTHVYVEEGDTVKSGDLLARLDDREAKSHLKRANANYERAKEDVVLAKRSLKRLKQAFEKGAVAKRLVEDAEIELRSAKARESIVEEEVRTAKLSLENPRIVAPFSGTITARYVEVGQWVVPSETLFTLIDEKQREVEVQVDAADSGGIAVGQTVTLSSDAFPGLEWNESVTRLAAATNNVGNANTVSVYISLGNNAPSLRFGQQVDADIRTAWNPNALKLPFGAISNRAGKSYVAMIQDDKVRFVEVVTGIEDFSHVEILQGVNVGQTVILANGLELHDSQKVFVATNSP